MSDLSEDDERRIYEHLLTLYKAPEWVVVWRGDKRKGGTGKHDWDDDSWWYHKTSGVDYEVYKVNGEVTVPDNTTEDEAKDLLAELRLFTDGAIYIETKKRKLKAGAFPQYNGLFINNHIDPAYKQEYPAGQYDPPPPDDIPVSKYGKLNKMLKFANKGADVFFVMEDERTGKYYVAHLTKKLIDELLHEYSYWTAFESPMGYRWEKNYDITWKHFALITGDNWDLDSYFINRSEKPKPEYVVKKAEKATTPKVTTPPPRLPVTSLEKKAVANAIVSKEVAEAEQARKMPPLTIRLPKDDYLEQTLIGDITYLNPQQVSKVNTALKANDSPYAIKVIPTKGYPIKVWTKNGTPTNITPIF
jgi:hypothetical protein